MAATLMTYALLLTMFGLVAYRFGRRMAAVPFAAAVLCFFAGLTVLIEGIPIPP